MNINEENKDLIENKIPWGLLDKETKERMKAWEHGWEIWGHNHKVGPLRAYYWQEDESKMEKSKIAGFAIDAPYRAKPAPARNECFIYKFDDGGIGVSPLNKTPLKGGKALWKITSDEDGGNPTFEVLDGNK